MRKGHLEVSCSHHSGNAPLARARGSWETEKYTSSKTWNNGHQTAGTADELLQHHVLTDLDLLQDLGCDLLTGELLWRRVELQLVDI